MRISDWSSDVCSSDLDPGIANIACHRTGAGAVALAATLQLLDQDVEATRLLGGDAIVRSEERRVGKAWSVRVDLGGRRIIKKKITDTRITAIHTPKLKSERQTRKASNSLAKTI